MGTYRSIYDDEDPLKIGGSEYLTGDTVNSMYAAGDAYTNYNNLTPQSERPISDVASQESYNVPKTPGAKGGVGGGVINGVVGIGAGLIKGINPEKQYSGIGLKRNNTDDTFDAISNTGAIGTIVGEGGRNIAKRIQKGSQDVKAGRWGNVARDVAANFLTMGLMSDPTQLGAERKRATMERAQNPETTLSAPITGAATGGYRGYATGGDVEMGKIEGPKGFDAVPIDGDLNNAAETGKKIVGFGDNNESYVKFKEGKYIFSKKTGFSKDADSIARKYKYNKDTDDFNGDTLAQQAFESDIGKLRDEQEAFNAAIMVDNYGMPELDTKGEYIIKDPAILEKIAKRRKSTVKSLVKTLGDTMTTQKMQEHHRADGGSPIPNDDGAPLPQYAVGGEADDDRTKFVADSTLRANQESLANTQAEIELLLQDDNIPSYTKEQLVTTLRNLVLQTESGKDLGIDEKYNITYGYNKPGTFDIGEEKKKISDMTVTELRQFQKDFVPGYNKRNKTNLSDYAAGAYQITGETLDNYLANHKDIDIENTKFDKDFQDNVFNWLLEQGGIDDVMSGNLSAREFYMGDYNSKTGKTKRSGMVQRWAALPLLYDLGTEGDKFYKQKGNSFYGGGINKATTDTATIEQQFKDLGAFIDPIKSNPERYDPVKDEYKAGTLPDVVISDKAVDNRQTIDSIAMNDYTLATSGTPYNPSDNMAIADKNPFSGPFKGMKKRRWEKENLNPIDANEYMASNTEAIPGAALGGYMNNNKGYATGGQFEDERGGQALRMLGMATPALYNIGYNLTQEPKRLKGNYAVSTAPSPEPIDITPELRDIEKAGASARAGGRARSSMAGQIASQTAEQEAVSKVYRDKNAIDLQADLQNEKINASIRQGNAQMKFAQDMQNIQAEEAHQQYMNTGMSQIGQIAQTLGTENLQRKQLETMQGYYDAMTKQGEDMIQLERDRLASDTEYHNRLLKQSMETDSPGSGTETKTSYDVTTAEGAKNWINQAKAKLYGDDLTEEEDIFPEGDDEIYTINEGLTELWSPAETAEGESGTYAIGSIPGTGYKMDEDFLVDGKPVINNMIIMGSDSDTGEELPYIKDMDMHKDFIDRLYLEEQGSALDLFLEDDLPFGSAIFDAPEALSNFDPLQYMSKEEYAQRMQEHLGTQGYKAVSKDADGNIRVYQYKDPSGGGAFGLGTFNDEATGTRGGRFVEYKKPTLLDNIANIARFGLETGGHTKTMNLNNMIPTTSFMTKTATGFEVVKQGTKVPKGVKAIVSPDGGIAYVKSNTMLQKGWKKIADAGDELTPELIKAGGGRAYMKGKNAAGLYPAVPHEGFYVKGTGEVIANATGKVVQGLILKPIKQLNNYPAINKVLGYGKQGMQKVYKGAQYIFNDGKWYKYAGSKAKDLAKGAQGSIKGAKEGIRTTVKNVAESAGVKLPKKAPTKVNKPASTPSTPNTTTTKPGISTDGKNAIHMVGDAQFKGKTLAERIKYIKENWKLPKDELDKVIKEVQRNMNAARKATT